MWARAIALTLLLGGCGSVPSSPLPPAVEGAAASIDWEPKGLEQEALKWCWITVGMAEALAFRARLYETDDITDAMGTVMVIRNQVDAIDLESGGRWVHTDLAYPIVALTRELFDIAEAFGLDFLDVTLSIDGLLDRIRQLAGEAFLVRGLVKDIRLSTQALESGAVTALALFEDCRARIKHIEDQLVTANGLGG